MKVLWRKLLRDIWRMKGQCIAVGTLIALGVASFVGAISTRRSLEFSRDTYYTDYAFAHVFTEVVRAPTTLATKLSAIEGVDGIQLRLASPGLLTLKGFAGPVSARLVGLPETGQPDLGRLHIRRGRLPEIGAVREVVVSEALANAQNLKPGDVLHALVDGRYLELVICGIGLSPEHIYEVRPGDAFPDNRRFGVLWVRSSILEEALGMHNAFNEAVFRLSRNADEQQVIATLDRELRIYGSQGAYGRSRHVSALFISEELKQLEAVAYFVPSIFLAVAVFLLGIVVNRIVTTQREQIATMKALGYGNATIAIHYIEFTTLVVLFGAILGGIIGYGFGVSITRMYAGYYRFSTFHYSISTRELVVSVTIAWLVGILGTLGAVRRAVNLQPAEAMRPASPAIFRRTLLEKIGVDRLLSTAGRMGLRSLSRKPLRAIASCVGVSFALALFITGMFFGDAVNFIIDHQFRQSQRQDLTVVFNREVPATAAYELLALPGVLLVEPQRAITATLRHAHRSYRSTILGLKTDGQLQRVLSTSGAVLEVPEHGLMISDTLASNLGASLGDQIEIELLEGQRNTRTAVVKAIADEPFGTAAYASIDMANALAGSGPLITSTLLRIEEQYQSQLFGQLQSLPTVAAVTSRKAMLEAFAGITNDVLLFFTSALTLFAAAMTLGVVYNAARISLSERERELATMRVIGLTRTEVFFVLFGELFALVAIALPLGCVLGYILATITATAMATDMYRVPAIVLPVTYVVAISVVLVSTVIAALVVRRRLDQLELVSVLKTKE